jgi:DedD protein
MTDSHEPSYYEIALTNRQVLVAFVVLLLCMLGAFFSGVWVGRGGTSQPPAVKAAAPAKSDSPLEEYAFFSDSAKPRNGGVAAPAAPPASPPVPAPARDEVPPAATPTPKGTTLAADLGAKPTATPAGPESMGEAGEPPLPRNDEPAPAKPPAPAPVPAPAPPAVAPPATSPAPTLGANEMVVQVFSSPDLAQAKGIVEKLKKGGYSAFLSPVQVGTQTMQRVRIGPYDDRARAQKVADDVKKKYRLDTWITR